MHNPQTSLRKRQIMLVLSYVIMTVVVLVVSAICILLILGYRFNVTSGTIEQGGLLQLRSVPGNANITVNQQELSFNTPGKLNVGIGTHEISFEKDGYVPWHKTVTIAAGELRWVNYARLIPETIDTEPALSLSGFSQALPSPNRTMIAVIENAKTPIISFVDIGDEQQPERKRVTLPKEMLQADATYRLVQWDSNSRYVLIEQLRKDGVTDFIRVDRLDEDESAIDVSEQTGLALDDVSYIENSSTRFYALTGDNLRQINISDQTISSPVVGDVNEYYLATNGEVSFSATRDDNQIAGVYIDDKETIVRTYDEDATPLTALGIYFSDNYLAVSHKRSLEIIKNPETIQETAGRSYDEVSLDFTPSKLSFSSSGRFVVAEHKLQLAVYDLETDVLYKTTYRQDKAPTDQTAINWFDSYYFYTTYDGVARIGEFDGGNRHDLADVIAGSAVTLNSDGKYFYSFAKDGDDYWLMRSRLILE